MGPIFRVVYTHSVAKKSALNVVVKLFGGCQHKSLRPNGSADWNDGSELVAEADHALETVIAKIRDA